MPQRSRQLRKPDKAYLEHNVDALDDVELESEEETTMDDGNAKVPRNIEFPPLIIDEERGNVGSKVYLIDNFAFGPGTSSRDPSGFDLPKPKIKDDEDLETFITKY
ncbi:hypothetical protein F0562_029580 [Nyssa sinensis]|uniref:Uncharacterized protein n=1 Tax=Nyssa sinensis TaxID=561372 RepID=A0A5J5B5M1_9ASTE|nr:hypothetical protein F0562_029580 [Nyssa sinensis]